MEAAQVVDWNAAIQAVIGLFRSLLPPLLTAAAALVGVWLTQKSAAKHRFEDRQHDLAVRKEDRADRDKEALQKEIFETFKVVTHLERYAIRCATNLSEYSSDPGSQRIAFPPWPRWQDIDWQAVGVNVTVKARDFERRRLLQKEVLNGSIAVAAAHETDADNFTVTATTAVGIEAWELAAEFREASSLPAFDFSGTWNYPETLYDFRRAAED